MYKLPSANNMKLPLFLRVDESELHYAWAAVLTGIVSELSINILFMLMIKQRTRHLHAQHLLVAMCLAARYVTDYNCSYSSSSVKLSLEGTSSSIEKNQTFYMMQQH